MFIQLTCFGGFHLVCAEYVHAEASLDTSFYIQDVLNEPISRSGNHKLEICGESLNYSQTVCKSNNMIPQLSYTDAVLRRLVIGEFHWRS